MVNMKLNEILVSAYILFKLFIVSYKNHFLKLHEVYLHLIQRIFMHIYKPFPFSMQKLYVSKLFNNFWVIRLNNNKEY